ncbi:hypothetical protein SDC9_186456 [bioreactor metagenome]|uniref:Phosphoribosyltransferase domain-containing protein n=1 Tax=bioreactor metagenome TaxID=1076179 RepID=A0A645HIT4_9ZZZZ
MIGRELNIPVGNSVIKRVRETKSQTKLGRQGRFRNMKNAFLPGSDIAKVICMRILLVDDVFTTGATFSACGGILLASGVKEVYGVVMAAGKNTF